MSTIVRERQSEAAAPPVAARDGRCPVCAGAAGRQREVVRAGAVAECAACGSWFRVPRPTWDELVGIYDQHYYDSWGHDDDEEIARATKRATFAPLLDEIARLLSVTDGSVRILDVGAATGALLLLAEERGWEPHALELNPYAAGVLRERFGDDRVFIGELPACSFPPGSFDVLTMTDLIEHVLDVPGTLAAALRLLRPGGVLCATTPRIDTLSRALLGRTWLHFKAEHIQYFSRRGLEGALRAAGFTPLRVAGHPKRLVFDYLHRQLRTYPHWLLTPMVTAVGCCLPRRLRRRPLPLQCGEMIALARRPR